MRLKHFLALFGLCAVGAGCAPLKQVANVIICQPAAYCMGMDECVACSRYSALAEEAWCHFQSAIPDCQYSQDFADGFKAGFADYLYAGGTGEPPLAPPRQYWRPNYQSPEGQLLILDWFKGYRHGAAVARESGYREAVTVPASAGLPRSVYPQNDAIAPRPTPLPPLDKTKPMPPAQELLPGPKELPGARPLPAPKALPSQGGAAIPKVEPLALSNYDLNLPPLPESTAAPR